MPITRTPFIKPPTIKKKKTGGVSWEDVGAGDYSWGSTWGDLTAGDPNPPIQPGILNFTPDLPAEGVYINTDPLTGNTTYRDTGTNLRPSGVGGGGIGGEGGDTGADPENKGGGNTSVPPPKKPYNYMDYLTSDPGYIAAWGTFNKTKGDAFANLRGAIRQMMISSGYDPTSELRRLGGDPNAQLRDEVNEYGAFIDDATREAMGANRYSTKNMLGQQRKVSEDQLRNALAARGLSTSGAFAGGTSVIGQNQRFGEEGALRDLLDKLGQGISGYRGIESGARTARDAAIEAVATRLAGLPAAPGGA